MSADSRLEDLAAAQFDTGGVRPGGSTCPASALAARFNPFDPEFVEDLYPFLARALVEEPVFYSPEIDHWVVTHYEDVREVFHDHETWSAANTLSAVTPMSAAVLQRLRDSGFRMNPVLTNLDPPGHARIRKHATNAFSTRHVAAAEEWIRALADSFIDRLLTHARQVDGLCHAEFVRDFAYDFPAHVAFRFLGVPDDRVADVKAWTRNRVMLTWGRCDEAAQLREVDGLIAMWKFCEAQVAATMTRDDPSFLGDLVRFHRDNPVDLTVNEIESILFTMLVAGHETTTNALSNAFATLLGERRLWERLVADPSAIPGAVEEILRYRSPIISWRRIAKRDTHFRGHAIAKGDRILLMTAAAHHDPVQFPKPEAVDIARTNAKRHLAFGHGVHLCIGAGLARLELKVALEQFTARLPALMLEADQALACAPNLSFRGPMQVKVHW